MRLTDRFSARVAEAVGAIPGLLQAERDQLDHEVIPVIVQGDQIKILVVLFVPVPGTEDQVAPRTVADDPYCGQPMVNHIVRALYGEAQEQIQRLQLQRSPGFGRTSASGLVLPS